MPKINSEEKEALKHLFFASLDFTKSKIPQYFDEIILVNKKAFIETGFSEIEFEKLISEWEETQNEQ